VGGSNWTSETRAEVEARLTVARAEGDDYAEARALTDLVAISHRLRDLPAMVTYAERAWDLSERNYYHDQLARLALTFADLAYRAQDYVRSYDHYANACAYAGMAGSVELSAAVSQIDGVLAELLATGRASIATALCELLVAYEADNGLGRADPAFAAHFQERLRQAEVLARADFARAAARLN
jgi:hypothetical protein